MSEDKFVVTVKGGKDHGSPWIVLHAASAEESAAQVGQARALLNAVRALSNEFQATEGANSAIGLLQSELGATVIEATGAWNEPAPAVEQPWSVAPNPLTQVAAPNPFGGAAENPFGAAAPTVSAGVLVKMKAVPKGDDWQDPKTPEGIAQKRVKDLCYQSGSKLKWNADRKGYEFESAPSAQLLATLRQNLPGVGGSLEG